MDFDFFECFFFEFKRKTSPLIALGKLDTPEREQTKKMWRPGSFYQDVSDPESRQQLYCQLTAKDRDILPRSTEPVIHFQRENVYPAATQTWVQIGIMWLAWALISVPATAGFTALYFQVEFTRPIVHISGGQALRGSETFTPFTHSLGHFFSLRTSGGSPKKRTIPHIPELTWQNTPLGSEWLWGSSWSGKELSSECCGTKQATMHKREKKIEECNK